MAAAIIDGKAMAQAIEAEVAAEASALREQGRPVKLAAVQVGDDPASQIYTGMQRRRCEQVGIDYALRSLPGDADEQLLRATLSELNTDASVTGIILQMPLPLHLDPRAMQLCIAPHKDAESVHPLNMGRLMLGDYAVAPCTPRSAMALLEQACDDLAGKEAVIVGHSEIVGKPIAAMLLASRDGAPTVTVCHVATRDLAFHTRRAEVLIVAAGVAQARWQAYRRARRVGEKPPRPDLRPLLSGDMLREGAIVIDVAINRIPEALDKAGEAVCDDGGKAKMVTVGDVDFAAAREKVAAITPVPGGVGVVTVAMLLKNTLACARLQGE